MQNDSYTETGTASGGGGVSNYTYTFSDSENFNLHEAGTWNNGSYSFGSYTASDIASSNEDWHLTGSNSCLLPTGYRRSRLLRPSPRRGCTGRGGCLSHRRFEPGTILRIGLIHEKVGGILVAPAIHVTETPEGDWLIGCSFPKKLNEEEMRAWL